MADIQDLAARIRKDVEDLIKFDEELHEGMDEIVRIAEKAEKIDETVDSDLGEIRELMQKVENGNHDEEELQRARQIIQDLKEVDYAEREEEHAIQRMMQILEELFEHGKVAIHEDEDLAQRVRQFEEAHNEQA
jgi:methyl-accepting chemotaxis protein